MHLLLRVFIILSAIGGFILSYYIFTKKRARAALVCPVGSDCSAVIHSEYSQFFGIPVEVFGMFYYAAIAVGYLSILSYPAIALSEISFGLFAMTAVAFLFSLYLVTIQAFALRQWCVWCLVSALISSLLFFAALPLSGFSFVALLSKHHDILLMLYRLGLAAGIGGTTVINIFFFKFLRDLHVSSWESDVLRTTSQVVWLALAVFLISGIGLYLPYPEAAYQMPAILTTLIIIGVLIASSAVLHFLVGPRLVRISVGERHHHKAGELRSTRRHIFALGAISLVSWYFVFVINMMPGVRLDVPAFLALYSAIFLAAIMVSLVLEHLFTGRVS
jgi:uncharacterized membrane protein